MVLKWITMDHHGSPWIAMDRHGSFSEPINFGKQRVRHIMEDINNKDYPLQILNKPKG